MKLHTKICYEGWSAVKIFYGGKTGIRPVKMGHGDSGKHTTHLHNLTYKGTQGTDGYPTRMMCDFKDK